MVHVIFFRCIKQKKYGCALLKLREKLVDCKFFVAIYCCRIITTFFSFDGKNFDTQVDATYEHFSTKLENYKGAPFVVGGWVDPRGQDTNKKTEIFDTQAGEWSEAEDYPFASKL